MKIHRNYPLFQLNTFHIRVDAACFAEVASVDEITECWQFASENQIPLLVLGGGSNVLFTSNFPGLVMKVNLKLIEVQSENRDQVIVKAGAGEVWDDFVKYCVDKGWGGLENLSLIPGSVGACPIQNIGAYGVEIKDRFVSLEYLDFENAKVRVFYSADCDFGYRNSIFKQQLKGKGVILSVTFKLSKKPQINHSYGAIQSELDALKVTFPDIADIRRAVINIRCSKLPDPDELGNSGSFFKNPEISAHKLKSLKEKYTQIVSYPLGNDRYKLAAGWLIDHCGWKGKRTGDAGVHQKQALVLVNYGNANGEEIVKLADKIEASVFDTFGVKLEREVNIIP